MLKLIIISIIFVVLVDSRTLIVGDVYDSGSVRKVFNDTYQGTAIPLFKRKQTVHFEYDPADKIIKGIAIKDLENGLAEPSITSGGLGFNYVDIKLKSARGSSFNYLIEIYA